MKYSADFSVVQEPPVSLGSEEELAGPPRMAPPAKRGEARSTQYPICPPEPQVTIDSDKFSRFPKVRTDGAGHLRKYS